MMKTLLFSKDENLISEWTAKIENKNSLSAYDLDSLESATESNLDAYVIMADYDTVATEVNKILSSNRVPKYLIVLEKTPEILIGKNLILRGIKAYGNARMLKIHFTQMLKAVEGNKVWTYPTLTAELAKTQTDTLSKEAHAMLSSRLTEKEQEVAAAVLEGLTNDAIAHKLGITERTVKAHMSSIFHKLHVSDRLSLVLLLKQ